MEKWEERLSSTSRANRGGVEGKEENLLFLHPRRPPIRHGQEIGEERASFSFFLSSSTFHPQAFLVTWKEVQFLPFF